MYLTCDANGAHLLVGKIFFLNQTTYMYEESYSYLVIPIRIDNNCTYTLLTQVKKGF